MTEKRFTINMDYECIDDAKEEIFIDFNDRIDFYELCEFLNKLNDENEQLKQYKDAIMNWDSSKIIRVNWNTGEVDLVDKELME